jgi:hypothetical protein
MKLIAALAAFTLAFTAGAFADKLEGEAKCAKCALKVSDTCHAVIVVKKDGKEEVIYAEKDDQGKALHGEICKGAKPATVEGTVTEKDGKKFVKITKYEVK